MVRRSGQAGSVLVSVIISLSVVAAVAYITSRQVGAAAHRTATDRNMAAAKYLAEAGLRHHLWQARKDNGQYQAAISGTLIGQGSYQSSLVKDASLNNRIHLTSTGIAHNGIRATLARSYTLTCTPLKTTLITKYDSKGVPIAIFEAGSGNTTESNFLSVDYSPAVSNSAHALIKFDLTGLPVAGIVSATLKLDVQQHDPAMEGGTLFANRVIKAWDQKVNWIAATAPTDKWATPGGDFTLTDQGAVTIAGGIATYNIDLTIMVNGWVTGSYSQGHNGLILTTNVKSSEPNHKLRFKKTPQLEVTHC